MRVTTFRGRGERVGADMSTSPRWKPFEEYDGRPLAGVSDDLGVCVMFMLVRWGVMVC
jgi:hypothetical protein